MEDSIHHLEFQVLELFLCKTNTLTILMHQMRILTTHVSSVMLRSLEIRRKKMWKLKELSDESKIECHEIETNPLKDRVMPEGDNPSFWDEFFENLLFSLTV
jgi:hypothetical protein